MSGTDELQAPHKVSRRQFLRGAALAGTGLVLAACAPQAAPTSPAATGANAEPTATPQVIKEVVTATPGPKGRTKVHYTASGDLEPMQKVLVPLVQQKLPDIDLTVDLTPFGSGWDTFADNVITRIAGGEGIDLIHIAIEGVALLTEKKILRPLDPFLEKDSAYKADIDKDIHPTLMKALNWKGQQMELPSDWNNMVMWYNYKIFASQGVPEPGKDWTWDDFVADCKALADVQGTANDRYAFSFWYTQFGMAPWFFNNNTSTLKNNWTDSNMDDPKVAETLQFLQDLILKYKVSPNPDGWDEEGNFESGHLVMRGCGGWCIASGNNNKFYDYKLQYYPHKAGPLKTVVGVGGDGIATMARDPDASWEVLKLINGPEYMAAYALENGSPMARRSIETSAKEMDRAKPSPADLSIYYQSLDYADFVPSPPNFNVIDPLLQRWYSQIWTGKITVAEACAGAHKELQAEMDKLKKS